MKTSGCLLRRLQPVVLDPCAAFEADAAPDVFAFFIALCEVRDFIAFLMAAMSVEHR